MGNLRKMALGNSPVLCAALHQKTLELSSCKFFAVSNLFSGRLSGYVAFPDFGRYTKYKFNRIRLYPLAFCLPVFLGISKRYKGHDIYRFKILCNHRKLPG